MASLKSPVAAASPVVYASHTVDLADGARDDVAAQGVDGLVRQFVRALPGGRERHDGDRLVRAELDARLALEEGRTGGGPASSALMPDATSGEVRHPP